MKNVKPKISLQNDKNNSNEQKLMRFHTLNLNPIYFDLIKNKEKTLEGRLNDEKRQNFNIGDTITFYKEPERIETINVIILNKHFYKNFDEMANNLDKKDLGFANSTKEEMIKVYRTIYSKENEDKYGVVIFKIKVIWLILNFIL